MARSKPMRDPAVHAPPATWDEFVELEEDDPRELIDGALVEIEVPGLRHERAVVAILSPLDAWSRSTKAGWALPSGYKVRITDRRGVMPDVQFISKEKLPLLDEKGLSRGAPDLVVEVISPSSRRFDRVVKLRWYASAGVGEYWLVDPIDRTLERLVLGADGRYTIAQTLADGDVFEPDSFPGLAIPLSQLWVDEPAG